MSARGHNDEMNAVMHGEFMAFIVDDGSYHAVRSWAERQGYPAATVQQGGPDFFASMLETAAPPKIVLIDIDSQSDPVGIASRLVSLCGADSKIIIAGSANDVSLYRQLLSTGIVDYLVKPLSSDNLAQAMALALRNQSAGKPEIKEAKTVVVLGTRGGVGATTLAVNLSWLLAHDYKYNCALLDLDMQFGTTALALDLEPGRGMRDIVSSPQRVDGLMIASSMSVESDQFSVLSAEEAVDEFLDIDGGAITALLKEMKTNFDYVVVDLPRHMIAAQKRLLSSSHHIFLATELSLSGIRDTLRIRSAINSIGYAGGLSIIVSRADSSSGQINQAAFEKGAQVKIDLIVPEDKKTIAQAANTGKALAVVARQAPVVKALHGMVELLVGKDAIKKPKASGSFLARLLKGNKGKSSTKNKGGDKA